METRVLLLASALLVACSGWESRRTGLGAAGSGSVSDAGGAGFSGSAPMTPLSVEIVTPEDGEFLSGTVTIAVTVEGVVDGIATLSARIDEALELQLVGPSHSAAWDTCTTPEGEHAIAVVLGDGSGALVRDDVAVVVDNASVAPVLSGRASFDANRLDWEHCGVIERYRVFWATEPGVDLASESFDARVLSALHRPETVADRYYYRVAALHDDRVGALSNEIELARDEAPDGRPDAVCSDDGWCWDTGAPQGHDLGRVWSYANHEVVASGPGVIVRFDGLGWSEFGEPHLGTTDSVWGAHPNDLWFGGTRLRHWDGTRIEVVEEVPNTRFVSVWGTNAENVWIYGYDGVYYFGGLSWQKLPLEGLTGYHAVEVWATGPTDVWAAGNGTSSQGGTLNHFDGTSWTMAHTGEPWLTALWGSGTADVWSVGEAGVLLHFDGTTWSRVESNTLEILNDVHGCTEDDVWAVGNHGTVIHFDGESWSDRSPPTDLDMTGVWCNGEGTAWVVGERGETLRWDGSWSPVTTERMGPLRSVAETAAGVLVTGEYETVLRRDDDGWSRVQGTVAGQYPNVTIRGLHGVSADDVWAVGDSGVTLHFDGETWETFPSVTSYDLKTVWALGPDDVWAAGEEGAIFHYDGEEWRGHSAGFDIPFIDDLWGAESDDVWAVGWDTILHYDGASWSNVSGNFEQGFTVRNVWGFAADDVYATTSHDSIIHWDGGGWGEYRPNVTVTSFLCGLHGSSVDDLWIVASDYYLHRDHGAWRRVETEFSWSPLAVWSRGPNDVFAVRPDVVRHFDGEEWSETPVPSVRSLVDVHGAGQDAYAVGEYGTVHKHDGDSWQRQMPSDPIEPQHLGKTWVESPNSLWVVGDYGTIRHYDGSSWEEHESGTLAQLFAVAGVSENDIWAAGEAGTMLHYDGEAWTPVPSGTDLNINGLWAEPGGTVIAVTGTFVEGWILYNGTVLRWDGASWVLDPAPNVPSLTSVWGFAPDDIWAVGDLTTLHFDGNAWTEVPLAQKPYPTMLAVWGSSPTSIWAVGAAGAIEHFDGTAWREQSTPGFSHLLAVGGTSTGVWAVGDDGAIWRLSLE